jgi:hypothetical protein
MLHQTAAPQAPTAIHTQASFSEIELCAHWSICPKTAHNRRKIGNMPVHFKQGHQVRYLVSDIEAYEQAQKPKPTPKSKQ